MLYRLHERRRGICVWKASCLENTCQMSWTVWDCSIARLEVGKETKFLEKCTTELSVEESTE